MNRRTRALTLHCVTSLVATGFSAGESNAQEAQFEAERAFPATFGIASAFPGAPNTGFIGLSLVYPRRGILPSNTTAAEKLDGDLVIGYTLGDPIDLIAVTGSVAITSLKGFAEDGAFGLGVARALRVSDDSLTFIGLSASNLGAWGDAALDPPAWSAYISHLFSVGGAQEVPVQITVGYGDQSTYDDLGIFVEGGWFYGIGAGLTPNLSASLSGTRNQVNIGFGLSHPRLFNWGASFGVYDVTDNVHSRQLGISVSRSF